MLLITGSFWFYAHRTAQIVNDQNEQTARTLVRKVLLSEHRDIFLKIAVDKNEENARNLGDRGQAELKKWLANFQQQDKNVERSLEGFQIEGFQIEDEYKWISNNRTENPYGYQQIRAYSNLESTGADDDWFTVLDDEGNQEFFYTTRIRAIESCLSCHQQFEGSKVAVDDELGRISIRIPTRTIDKSLSRNNAILLATAILTAFMAMLAAYAIVRYVIVKPVLHLKDVSDEIARGNLDLRADINTGDEFEELSHAFNRMLRHQMTTHDELREANKSLDGKVDELAQVNLRLYETNKLKDDFLATITHELRTPLNSILGFSDVLAGNEQLSDTEKRYVENIKISGKNLMALINDLLDLAKIESGKMDLQPSDFQIGDVVDRQASAMMPLATKKNIELTVDVSTSIPPVMQDRQKIEQILNNLLSNAVKFTPEGGRVRVSANLVDSPDFQIVVEDTGIGIPLPDQDRIFEKFRQGSTVPGEHQALTREYEGTGLGLSIVRELSKLLGGTVTLESQFGKGSAFTITLPLHVSIQLPEPKLPDALDRPSGMGLNRLPMESGGRPRLRVLTDESEAHDESV